MTFNKVDAIAIFAATVVVLTSPTGNAYMGKKRCCIFQPFMLIDGMFK